MGRIVLFFVFLGIIMLYPIFVLLNQKVVKKGHFNENVSLYTIFDGKFKKYEQNLTEMGYFKRFDVFKNYYLSYDLNVTNILKHENYFAKKAKYQKPYLYAYFFIYKNEDYLLKSSKARYNFNTKNFSGKKFILIGKTYKARGKSFLVDKYKNIKATYPIFDLKVK